MEWTTVALIALALIAGLVVLYLIVGLVGFFTVRKVQKDMLKDFHNRHRNFPNL